MSNIITNENTPQKWSRIVLFHAVEHTDPILLWGEPIDPSIDVGLALSSQTPKEVKVKVWQMMNPEDADAHSTEEILTVKTLFCPIDTKRPSVREASIGQQSSDITLEAKPQGRTHNETLRKTTDPPCYVTRTTSSGDTSDPAGPQLQRHSRFPLNLPDISQCPDCVTFSPAIKDNEEMHLMLQFTVLMKAGQGPIPKQNAVDYVAGYTLVVSSAVRIAGDTSDPGPDYQGIDAFCPFGPVLVSPGQLPDPAELSVQVVLNGEEKEVQAQGATLKDVQSTMKICTHDNVLRAGGMTMNGTPAGHLRLEEPVIRMRKGDRVVIKASHGIGHLMNSVYSERVPGAKRVQMLAAEEDEGATTGDK